METPIPQDINTPCTGMYTPLDNQRISGPRVPEWEPCRTAVTPLQLAGMDPMPSPPPQGWYNGPRCFTTQQIKGVTTFTGKSGPRIEDWVRDMKYILESKGPALPRVQFNEIVRHTGGRARDLLLNLELCGEEHMTPSAAFRELLEEYGDGNCLMSPMAEFYGRMQQTNESPSEYAVALEAKLRVAKDRGEQAAVVSQPKRDSMLATQFMHGLRDQRVRARLAPMRPREMTFRELRGELRVIEAEEKVASAQMYRQEVKQETKENQALAELTRAMQQLATTQQQHMELIHQTVADQERKLAAFEGRLGQAQHYQNRGMRGVNRGGRQTQQPRVCFTCGQPGHFYASCPHQQRAGGLPNMPEQDLN